MFAQPLYSRMQGSLRLVHRGFHGFSGILNQSDILQVGQSYTFTFEFPFYSQYPSDADAIAFLGESLSKNYGIATVTKASRSLFSSNYAVTIVPTQSMDLASFVMAFDDAWNNSPWYVAKPTFVQAEGGVSSSQPGGLTSMVSDVTGSLAQAVSGGLGAATKNLWPWLLVGGGIFVLVTMGPTLARKRGLLS